MKFLHTSDWHIGRTLYGKKRYDEFEQFFAWLADEVREHQVDALLVSGDVFDTTTPSNRSQEIYYRFLFKMAASCCRHVVIIGGNHDSPTFLDAPQALLKAVNIHVQGAAADLLDDEVIRLENDKGDLEAVVCAVPYLRDRDIRSVKVNESLDDKAKNLVNGIREHYAKIGALAGEIKKEDASIPVIGMGHLFAAGGQTIDGDGVRQLHVGSLSQVGADVFGRFFDYVALGHLHVPQIVDKKEYIRYSGSPIPMGFGEAENKKQVLIVDFQSKQLQIQPLPVPCFQELKRISGNMQVILEKLKYLTETQSTAWLEVEYTGDALVPDLKQQVETALETAMVQVRRIKNRSLAGRIVEKGREAKTLDDLDELDVFERLLAANKIEGADREALLLVYQEAVQALAETDVRAD